jgi:hypothetical protein
MKGIHKVLVVVLAVAGACLTTVVMKQARGPAELFAHGGATDFVGRKPRASAFHSFPPKKIEEKKNLSQSFTHSDVLCPI